MTRTILLTLGRLPVALDLARAFSRDGHRVVVADPMRVNLARTSRAVAIHSTVTAPSVDPARYLDDLMTIVQEEAIDLVVPVSEEIAYAAALVGRLPPGVHFYGVDQPRLLRLHDKLTFNRRAHGHGLDAPTSLAADDPQATAFVRAQRTVLKPRFSCAGFGVRFLEPSDPPEALPPGHLVQARIDGRSLSSFSVVREGVVLGTAVYEPRLLSGAAAVCFERIDHAPTCEWIEQFVAAEGYTGFVGFDVIVDATGRVLPIECNPRTTSGIHFFEPNWLAAAVLRPETAGPPQFRVGRRAQQFWSALAGAYTRIHRPRSFVASLAEIVRARDVLWDPRDPFVFPLMTFASWPVVWGALRSGQAFGVVATRDIAWDGKPPRLPDDGPGT